MVSKEAEKLMSGIRGDAVNKPNMSKKSWNLVQKVCEHAQLRMIDSHWDNMDEETKVRATLVKAGQYRGQKIT